MSSVSRREFVERAAVGVGAVASGIALAKSAQAANVESADKQRVRKLGVLDDYREDRLVVLAQIGYECMSVKVRDGNPAGQAISSADGQKKMLDDFAKHGLEISALAAYTNYLHPANETNEKIQYLKSVVQAAGKMGVKTVAAMTGRDPAKSIDESIPDYKSAFEPVARVAEDSGVKVVFENWVGGDDINHGINIGICPDGLSMMFDAVPSDAIGFEYDPSHLYWQGIDHIRVIHEFGPRIHHVHLKDVEILPDKMYRRGCTGGAFHFRIPGWGQLKWQDIFTALLEENYNGNMVVEHEDGLFSKRNNRFDEGLRLAHDYLRPIFPSW
ncbi:MAG: sugar phosphate isomerase/epimerase [bacterium]